LQPLLGIREQTRCHRWVDTGGQHALRDTTGCGAGQPLSRAVVVTCASAAAAVAERSGHASPNITLGIYSHALPMDNQATAQLWDNAMSEVIESSREEALKSGRLSQGYH
jgi:hypothetical protein